MIYGEYQLGKKKLDLSKNKNFKKFFPSTGIRYVYKTGLNENTLTLSKKVLTRIKKKINLSNLEALIFISQSPISTIPPTTSFIHKEFNLPTNCFTLDLIQGCSSFPYAFFLANRYLKDKVFKNVLILSSETYRDYISISNKSSYPIFSDGASAIYMDNKTKIKILSEVYYTDGKGSKDLCTFKKKLIMNGPAVFFFTKTKVPIAVKSLLKKSRLKINQIDYFYFHQASKLVLNNIRSSLKIPDNKVLSNVKDIGNTVSSTIPIMIIDDLKKKKIKKNKNIMIIGFGVGYSLSGGIFKFV